MGSFAGRIPPMATEVEEDHPDLRDPAALFTEAANKAEKLLVQLIAEQVQLEQNPPKLSIEAMDQIRSALAETIAAVRQTIVAVRKAIPFDPSAIDPIDSR